MPYICVFGSEERAGAITRDILDYVRIFLAAVIASTRISFRILVGKDRSKGCQYFWIGVILRGDHLDAIGLAALLSANSIGDILIEGLELRAIGVHGRLPSGRWTDI